VEIINRDCTPAYAAGINEGAPLVVQVADRFHLLENVREVLEKVIYRQNRFLPTQTMVAPISTTPMLEKWKSSANQKESRCTTCRNEWSPERNMQPEKLKDDEQNVIELLQRLSPDVARAQNLAGDFVKIVKERQVDGLRG